MKPELRNWNVLRAPVRHPAVAQFRGLQQASKAPTCRKHTELSWSDMIYLHLIKTSKRHEQEAGRRQAQVFRLSPAWCEDEWRCIQAPADKTTSIRFQQVFHHHRPNLFIAGRSINQDDRRQQQQHSVAAKRNSQRAKRLDISGEKNGENKNTMKTIKKMTSQKLNFFFILFFSHSTKM